MLKEIREIIDKSLADLNIESNFQYALEMPPACIDADLSTNIALLISKKIKKNPKEIALIIIEKIKQNSVISDAIFLSGFINIKLSFDYIFENLEKEVLHTGLKTQDTENAYKNKKILVEFVSANPTGPLHIGHGRGAAYGDSLARVFEYLGANVEREYYVNDVGNQMDVLAQSVLSYINNKPLPENGYKGKYLEEIAKEIQDTGYRIQDTEVKAYTINKILEWIKNDLEKFGIWFKNWFRESSLYEKNEVDKIIEELLEKGFAYKKDGAIWFKSTEFSDDKDRVIVREDGRKTYLASDIAYHYNKFQRNFDEYIDIWGADHHGYVDRMKGAVKATGSDETKLKIILYQLVNIIKGGQKVTMSTRAGEFVTLKEVLDEVGVDASRFFLLMRNSESHLDFDLDLAIKQTPENPVYYIQYAHARISSIFKEAEKRITDYRLSATSATETFLPTNGSVVGADKKSLADKQDTGYRLLNLKEERELIRKVLYFEDLVKIAARDYAPNYMTKYLQDIASDFHSYYNKNRIVTDNPDLTLARLQMCQAIKNIIYKGLYLLGVSAPEKM